MPSTTGTGSSAIRITTLHDEQATGAAAQQWSTRYGASIGGENEGSARMRNRGTVRSGAGGLQGQRAAGQEPADRGSPASLHPAVSVISGDGRDYAGSDRRPELDAIAPRGDDSGATARAGRHCGGHSALRAAWRRGALQLPLRIRGRRSLATLPAHQLISLRKGAVCAPFFLVYCLSSMGMTAGG